jgi:hypothetical protein
MLDTIPFEILETPVLYDVDGQLLESTKHKMLYRSDNNEELYTSKASYVPMSNEHFMETTEKMKEISGFEITGYQLFQNGVIVLSYLKNNQDDIAINGCKIDDYLMLGSSCNTRFPFFVGTTTILLRCQNQFSRINRIEKIKHTHSTPKKIDELMRSYELYFKQRKEMYENFERMHNYEIDIEIKKDALAYIMKLDKQEMLDSTISSRKLFQVDQLSRAMNGEISELGKNLFGMFNGVTKFTTHILKTKNNVFGNVFGNPAEINKRAYEFSMQLIEN